MASKNGPLLLAFAIVGGSGYYHGVSTGRWTGNREELQRAGAKVHLLPRRIGDWIGKDSAVEDPDQFVRAGVHSYLVRHYTNSATGEILQVMLVCGRPGPVAAHTPEVCYSGAGFSMISNAERVDLKSADYFSRALFKVNAPNRPFLDIAWALTARGTWSNPSTARFVFGREEYLYKLYVIHQEVRTRVKPQADVLREFLNEIVPALRAALFTGDGT